MTEIHATGLASGFLIPRRVARDHAPPNRHRRRRDDAESNRNRRPGAAIVLAGVLAVGLAVVTAAPAAGAQTQINNCTTITQPGEYVLTTDVTNRTVDDCIDIRASDVKLDGAGHLLDGVDTDGTVGVYANGTAAPLSNVAVRNLRVTDWGGGVRYQRVSDGAITDVTAASTTRVGVGLSTSETTWSPTTPSSTRTATVSSVFGSSGNTLVNSTVASNAGYGLSVASSTNNGFFDNAVVSNGEVGVAFVDLSTDNRLGGNTIESNGGVGISLRSSSNDVGGNTIESNGGAGAAIENAGDISLSSNVVSANDGEGIVVFGGNRSLVTNNTVTGNGRAGIALLAGAANNSIVNNVFRNDDNVDLSKRTIPGAVPFVPAGGPNTWNRSKTQGPNRAGGPFLGGNYYARTNGTGFSQTCADADGDGLCDSPNDFGNASDDNTDFLPLTGPCTFDTPGDVTGNGKVATDPDCDGFYEDANGDGTVDAVDVQAIFANRNDPAVADNPGEFDFTRNGKFNVVDLQKLFFELTGETRP
ncbi:hypothetical protein BRC90_05415 [Halobacteriales archaeon QS_4_69_34]|nr:MAG: hypothetical protein BRC90_05415 [Halobacteriales archaeon QS_4_69_34]